MKQPTLWIDGISAAETTGQAAARSLHFHLETVQSNLRLAAKDWRKDSEYVHQLRVATRRALAALRIYGHLLPERDVQWLSRTLRKMRRVAGEARDLDVLGANHTNDKKRSITLGQTVGKKRRAAQRPIYKMYRKLSRSKKRARIFGKGFSDTICDQPGAQAPFQPWAVERLADAVSRFFEAMPSDASRPKKLHRFRIRCKEFRYSIELLAGVFPERLRAELYPRVVQIQNRLGKIQDSIVAIKRLKSWRKEAERDSSRVNFKKMIKREKKKLARRLQRFARWWTPDHQEALHNTWCKVLRECPGDRPAASSWQDADSDELLDPDAAEK